MILSEILFTPLNLSALINISNNILTILIVIVIIAIFVFYERFRMMKMRKYADELQSEIRRRIDIEESLIKTKKDLENSDRIKSEFLIQISHEIRTPINSILSFSSMLQDELEDKLPDDLKDGFKVITTGGQRLIRTINLIIDLAQLQSGAYKSKFDVLNIEDVLRSVILDARPYAEEKKLSLSYEKNPDVSPVYADSYALKQIFSNLVDNAIKFTFFGGVEISVNMDTPETLAVEISDTGIGISEEFIPNLFKEFSQEYNGYSRRFEGNGLGLSLVKKYADINNLKIKVESVKDVGSTFTILFNVDLDEIKNAKTVNRSVVPI